MTASFVTHPGRAFCFGLATALAVMDARAGPIADAFVSVEELLEAGDARPAWEAFNRATELFWAEAPMTFRRALLVESATGYGQYVPRAEPRYAAADSMIIYLEPVGYGWTAIGEEYRIRLTLDLQMATAEGQALLAEPGFAVLERVAQTRGREFQATIDLTVPDLPAGDYLLSVTLGDAATGKSATTEIAFAIAE